MAVIVMGITTLVLSLGAWSWPVQPGDTLSGIAAAHGDSLASVETANPQIADQGLIYAGDVITGPGGSGGALVPPAPAVSSPAPAASSPAPAASSSGSGYSAAGVPQSFLDCIAYRESTNGTNPAAGGNVFGIIPASGYNVAGESLAQQEQVVSQLYARYGSAPWTPSDGC